MYLLYLRNKILRMEGKKIDKTVKNCESSAILPYWKFTILGSYCNSMDADRTHRLLGQRQKDLTLYICTANSNEHYVCIDHLCPPKPTRVTQRSLNCEYASQLSNLEFRETESFIIGYKQTCL